MVVLDTSVAIEKVKKGEKIRESITAVTMVEFPKNLGVQALHWGCYISKDQGLLHSL